MIDLLNGTEDDFTRKVEAAATPLGVTVVCRRISHVPGPNDEFVAYDEYQAWCRERMARWFFPADGTADIESALRSKL